MDLCLFRVGGIRLSNSLLCGTLVCLSLILPLCWLPTTQQLGHDLVEIRLDIESVYESPKENYVVFVFSVFALTQISVKIGIPIEETLLSISPKNGLASHITSMKMNYRNFEYLPEMTSYEKFSAFYPKNVLTSELKPNTGFEIFKLFIIDLSITYDDVAKLPPVGSYIFLPQNFLMVPLVGHLFARDTGFEYTSRVYSGNRSWSNPSNPLITNEYMVSLAIVYFRYSLGLLSAYFLFLLIELRRFWDRRRKLRYHYQLYPSQDD